LVIGIAAFATISSRKIIQMFLRAALRLNMVPRPNPEAAPINAAAITMAIEDAFFPPANRKPTYAKHNVQRTMRKFMGNRL